MSPYSGLGINYFSSQNPTTDDTRLRQLQQVFGNDIRVDIVTYGDAQLTWQTKVKACVVQAVALGMNVTFGISSNGITITATNWPDYHAAILDFAAWSQTNGVYEFQLGNEEELHNDDSTFTDADVITNMKSTATEVQAIFTRGPVSYSVSADITPINAWVTAGRGDLDYIGLNTYSNYFYPVGPQTLFTAFGADHAEITEFGPHFTSLAAFNADEGRQATRVKEMIDKLQSIGYTRYKYFCFKENTNAWGALAQDDHYRLLWNNLTSKRWWFINS